MAIRILGFDEWMGEQQAMVQGQVDGAQYAQTFGCLGCHSTGGSVLVGPTFQGLFGSQRTFEDGTTGVADEVTDEQLEALIEFIAGLK